ncbi:MAG: IS110 family transposase [Alphaproteobacteria bacterium]|nr:IS110 family transposase [Alphaproteobacteria bacterium]
MTTARTGHAAPFDYTSTLVVAVEISDRSWMLGAHVPGSARSSSRLVIEPAFEQLIAALAHLTRRAALRPARTVVVYEAGHTGFWLARLLRAQGMEAHVLHPASVPVDRRARRAKTDRLDVDLLLRAVLAWLRGEPGVCSMATIPDEADEDQRRAVRERQELLTERTRLTNRVGALLSILGVSGYDVRRSDRRARLAALERPEGVSIPPCAKAKLERLIARYELVVQQIEELEAARDQVLEREPRGEAEAMIQRLCTLKGIGAQSATVLVREGFVRQFRNGRALGSYAGLTGTPWASGGYAREQGISKAGNRHLRTVMVEIAWLWRRWQPESALARWLTARAGDATGRLRRVLITALARKLLIALWRFACHGIVPEGALLKAA